MYNVVLYSTGNVGKKYIYISIYTILFPQIYKYIYTILIS